VFKITLKELINDIHKNHILGCTIAGIYVVEFQKCGLPHAHILIFFTKNYKPHTVEDVDRMISAELPNSKNKQVGPRDDCQMHDAWSTWSCVSKSCAWKKANVKKIPTQVPIRDGDGCKRIPYLSA
jgi:hypothetical protein